MISGIQSTFLSHGTYQKMTSPLNVRQSFAHMVQNYTQKYNLSNYHPLMLLCHVLPLLLTVYSQQAILWHHLPI